MIEDVSYDVTIVIRLSTRIEFAPMEREGPVTRFDAIDNAVGCIPAEIWDQIDNGFSDEFSVAIDFETKKLL